jgi:hypothetical protein
MKATTSVSTLSTLIQSMLFYLLIFVCRHYLNATKGEECRSLAAVGVMSTSAAWCSQLCIALEQLCHILSHQPLQPELLFIAPAVFAIHPRQASSSLWSTLLTVATRVRQPRSPRRSSRTHSCCTGGHVQRVAPCSRCTQQSRGSG